MGPQESDVPTLEQKLGAGQIEEVIKQVICHEKVTRKLKKKVLLWPLMLNGMFGQGIIPIFCTGFVFFTSSHCLTLVNVKSMKYESDTKEVIRGYLFACHNTSVGEMRIKGFL